ncbi:hypothetical protein PCL_02768 [Purpureocillium lilacinum]|uniref:Flavin prenyltransferase PAD1, mitochondrial n=2 Tax=Purpureocillium lilacinum TaxID=33203 RepID=A0A2U3E028_PURLI|nr:hypothetical protein PCL_02768 [Purpureocillium lilacinum]
MCLASCAERDSCLGAKGVLRGRCGRGVEVESWEEGSGWTRYRRSCVHTITLSHPYSSFKIVQQRSITAMDRPDYTDNTATEQKVERQEVPRPPPRRKRIIVAMTGATGSILGVKTLLALRRLNVETHLVMSKWAEATLKHETDYTGAAVRALADHAHSHHDMAAPIASGSFRVDGMVVVPCSMKTLAAVAAGHCDDLVARAADVVLKERRRLVLVARECPLSGVHIDNMARVTRSGAVVFPPVMAFYHRPGTVEDLVDHAVGRMLDLFDLETGDFERWNGFQRD